MNAIAKNIIAVIVFIAVLAGTIVFLQFRFSKQLAESEARVREITESRDRIIEQFAKAEIELDELKERTERATELVRSSGSIIGELRDSVESTSGTIKQIREQQQRIRAAVIDLINDYNEIARELDGATEGE